MKKQEIQKYKILIVHNYYQIPGGEDTVVSNEKELLEQHGHAVVLYSRHNSELKEMSRIQKLTLPFITIFNPRTYRDIIHLIDKYKIDIVHVHNTLSLISPSVYYAAFTRKIPVVQTIHNFRMLCPGATFYREGHICEDCVQQGLRCAIKHNCYRNSKIQTIACVINLKIHRLTGIYKKLNYICLTEFNKEKLLQLNKPGKKEIINPDKVFVKPNFTFEMRKASYPRGGGKGYFVYVGRVEEIKGLPLLLKAFELLPEEILYIAGTGNYMLHCKEFIEHKEIKNIVFTGFLCKSELCTVMREAKAIIVPSQWYETFGMVIIEAFSESLPAIVGDIGNIGELVQERKTGLHFKYNSFEALIEAIKNYQKLEDEIYRENAYNVFLDLYSSKPNYRQLYEIYHICLESDIRN